MGRDSLDFGEQIEHNTGWLRREENFVKSGQPHSRCARTDDFEFFDRVAGMTMRDFEAAYRDASAP